MSKKTNSNKRYTIGLAVLGFYLFLTFLGLSSWLHIITSIFGAMIGANVGARLDDNDELEKVSRKFLIGLAVIIVGYVIYRVLILLALCSVQCA